MTLIAITLNWKDDASTIRCVTSLLESNNVSKIIVLDNESEGSLREKLEKHSSVEILENTENLGFASAINLGLERALKHGAEYILVINNDATIAPDSVRILYDEVSVRGFDLAAPTLLNEDGSLQSKGEFIDIYGRTSSSRSRSTISEYITWACVMLTAKAVNEVGYLDTRYFMYYEDVDYSLRLKKAGLKSGVIPKAKAKHSLNKSHGKAGIKIELYTTASILSFGRKWKRTIPMPYTLGRVAIRVSRQALNFTNLSLCIKACQIGWRVTKDCYKEFSSIAKREHAGGKGS